MTTSQTGGGGGLVSALLSLIAAFFRSPPAPAATVVTPPGPPPPVGATSEEEIDVVARTLWGEARGEPDEGVEAVAAVLVNRRDSARAWLERHPDRSRHPLFGSGTLVSAALADPKARYRQFSCWNVDDPNRAKLEEVTDQDERFRVCLDISRRAAVGTLADRTAGATHYYDRRLNKPPPWSVGATQTVAIGHHLFFRGVS